MTILLIIFGGIVVALVLLTMCLRLSAISAKGGAVPDETYEKTIKRLRDNTVELLEDRERLAQENIKLKELLNSQEIPPCPQCEGEELEPEIYEVTCPNCHGVCSIDNRIPDAIFPCPECNILLGVKNKRTL